MKRYELRGDFGLDNLELVERPEPEPSAGEVVLEMSALSPNYRDLMMIRGSYNPDQPLPLVPFSDGVGEVVAVGDGVERFEEGDRGCPIFVQSWLAGPPNRSRVRGALGGPLDGTLTEFMAVPAESVVEPPEHLSDVEAATLPCTGVTAWH
ncbi:MAG: alcohol dehydrogenase catalytic domain-containing protein, partial [Bradymonadaceae bacterium]